MQNITALVGANGSGKSSLLNFIKDIFVVMDFKVFLKMKAKGHIRKLVKF